MLIYGIYDNDLKGVVFFMPKIPRTLKIKKIGRNMSTYRKGSTARGYGHRWQQARKRFLDKYPLCQCDDCEKNNRLRTATVVHHIIPHKGNKALFWDEGNWMAMSKRCHDKHTATVERKKYKASADGG